MMIDASELIIIDERLEICAILQCVNLLLARTHWQEVISGSDAVGK